MDRVPEPIVALECLDPFSEREVAVEGKRYASVRTAVVSFRFKNGNRLCEGGDLAPKKLARKLHRITGNHYSSSSYLVDAAAKHSSLLGLVPKEKPPNEAVLTLAVTCLNLLQNPPLFMTALQAGMRKNPLRPASCPLPLLLEAFHERHSFCHCGSGRHSRDEGGDFSGDWVECDSCSRWFHLECTSLRCLPSGEEEWECGRCGEFADLSPLASSLERLVHQIRTSMRSESPSLTPVKEDLSLLSRFILSEHA